MSSDSWLTLIIAAFVYMVFLSIWRHREGIMHKISRILVYLLITSGIIYLLKGENDIRIIIVAITIGLAASHFLIPERSRYIPKSVRRKIIADYEYKTGRKKRKSDEIDHIIPLSKGGSNTPDNLRVVTRKKNRSKGAKSPWWDLLGR